MNRLLDLLSRGRLGASDLSEVPVALPEESDRAVAHRDLNVAAAAASCESESRSQVPPGEPEAGAMTDTLMRARHLWSGALVTIDGETRGMVHRAHDGAPVQVMLRDGTRTILDVEADRLVVVKLPAKCWTHSCGMVIRQRGNRTNHCGVCHVTFEGWQLGDAHRRESSTGTVCLDPAHMKFQGARVRFVPDADPLVDGAWRGPKLEVGHFD